MVCLSLGQQGTKLLEDGLLERGKVGVRARGMLLPFGKRGELPE
jgi:hypothetical protein